jgi:hypothetical protein
MATGLDCRALFFPHLSECRAFVEQVPATIYMAAQG